MEGSTSKPIILIASNDLHTISLQQSTLKDHDYSVYVANSLEQALALADRYIIDLVVIDESLAKHDKSIGLLAPLRKQGCLAPALLVTSFEEPELMLSASNQGIRDIIPKKPEFLDILPSLAQTIIRRTKSEQHLHALNEQLQASAREAHHRIKNSLQNVISLLNLRSNREGDLSKEEVAKLAIHIHGLAAIHEQLAEQSKRRCLTYSIALDMLFERMVNFLSKMFTEKKIEYSLETCHVTPRQAASLTIILTELVSNALKHADTGVLIKLSKEKDTDEDVAKLLIISDGAQVPENFKLGEDARSGLTLAKILSQADLQSEPEFTRLPEGRSMATVTIPLLQKQQI